MNIPLFSAIMSIASTVLMGAFIIAIVVLDKLNATTMIGAIVAGLLISLPIALVVTKKISTLK